MLRLCKEILFPTLYWFSKCGGGAGGLEKNIGEFKCE